MKRVLQHRKTGLYLKPDGLFTRDLNSAHVCPNLAAAMIVCAQHRLSPTEFVYKLAEPNQFLGVLDRGETPSVA